MVPDITKASFSLKYSNEVKIKKYAKSGASN